MNLKIAIHWLNGLTKGTIVNIFFFSLKIENVITSLCMRLLVMYKHGRIPTSQCCGGSLDKNLRLSEADILILVAP